MVQVRAAPSETTTFAPAVRPFAPVSPPRPLAPRHAGSGPHRRCAGARRSVRLDSPAAVLHRGAHAADRARGHLSAIEGAKRGRTEALISIAGSDHVTRSDDAGQTCRRVSYSHYVFERGVGRYRGPA